MATYPSVSPTAPPSKSPQGLVATLILIALGLPMILLSPWILSVALILTCGIYVAFEFALVKIPLRELEREAEAGVPGAVQVLGMKRDLNAMLAACQFGITLTSLGLTLALEPAIHHAIERYEQVAAYSGALAMGLGTFFHVTFGELIPKGLALVVPRRVLQFTAPFMMMFRWLAVPFIKSCNAIANVVVKALSGRDPDQDAHHDAEIEIDEALIAAHTQGQIAPNQLRVMRNVLSFADRSAREVMTPARSVVALDLQDQWELNLKRADEHGYSRFPVISGDPHNILGYVRRADLLRAELQEKRDLSPLVRPIEKRPETASLTQLSLFRGTPMLALYDEHGSFSGLLTAEDVIEQIVGEIYDETDEPISALVEDSADGSVLMAGSLLLELASEHLHLPLLDDQHPDVDTIGGLILKRLARQPKLGDVVELDGWRATVEGVDGFRIEKLRFERPEPPDAGASILSP